MKRDNFWSFVPELCGFGVISLQANVGIPLDYEYVFIEVLDNSFTLLPDGIAYNISSCYYGMAYNPADPPNLDTGNFTDLV